LADGSSKLVADIRAGDVVRLSKNAETGKQQQSSDGSDAAVVECVVKTLFDTLLTSPTLIRLPGGLLVTPWHPVKDPLGKWVFPCEYPDAVTVEGVSCDAVYSFVLKKCSESEKLRGNGLAMIINDIECATLGHGIEDPSDSVISHPFYGTSKVVDSLMKFKGWANGHVVMRSGCVYREEASGLVCGFHSDSEIYF